MSPRKAFTLIELLVVIAIIAILAVVVVLTLNPAQLLAQSRDANRVGDMATLNSAIGFYQTDTGGIGFAGTSTVVYVSLPDTTSTCANLGLPALPVGYIYDCSTSTSSKLVNSQGWIPINFSLISSGPPFGSLPVDPTNTSSSGLYYAYAASGTQYMVSALPESQKEKTALATGGTVPDYPDVIANGNSFIINPVYNPAGIVGYWPMDEGSGSSTQDLSGHGNIATLNGAVWTGGKLGNALSFSSTTYAVAFSSLLNPSAGQPFTASAWINNTQTAGKQGIMGTNATWDGCGYFIGINSGQASFNVNASGTTASTANVPVTSNQWHYVTAVYDGANMFFYADGRFGASSTGAIAACGPNNFNIGKTTQTPWGSFLGSIDDARVYNRALSAAEIQALYNAEY